MTAARVRLPDGAGPAERSVLALLADLAGRGGQVTIDPAHVGPVTCLHRTGSSERWTGCPPRGLLRREGRTVVLTAAHRPSGDQT